MNKKLLMSFVVLLGSTLAGPVSAQAPGSGHDADRVLSQTEVRALLQQRGWAVHTDSKGSLVLRPASSAQAPGGEDELGRLGTLLGERGWRTERDERGDLLLFPPSAPSGPAVGKEPLPRAQGRLEDLKKVLDERGWTTGWDSTGNLLLSPADTGVVKAEQDTEGGARPSTIPASDTKALEAALRQRGWGVERDAQGALRVSPPAAPVPAEASDTTRNCQFVIPEPVRQGRVQLPVDQWGEAHDLAMAWIGRHGDSGLAVGKIRRINQIYLVSVVAGSAPFPLRNQLAIRVGDGAVVALLE